MMPYLVPGTAIWIEDASVLRGLLEYSPKKMTLHETLQMYEKLRNKRTSKITNASTNSRHLTQMEHGPEQEAHE